MDSLRGVGRFARTLATLYEGGVLLTQALEATRNTLNNAALAEALDRVLERVVRGESLSAAMAREPLFLPILVRLAWWERRREAWTGCSTRRPFTWSGRWTTG